MFFIALIPQDFRYLPRFFSVSVLRETLLLALIGIALGLPAALISTRLTKELLFGLIPNDPLTIALATLVMIAIAALAGYLPARRAAQVDPLIALRHE